MIPTFRRPDRLRDLLSCLARQSGDALARVVVADDGSGDETEAVARAFEHRLPLHYAWQEDLGFRAGQARNLGIDRAVGDVVIFVDDDVVVREDFVSQHLAAHRAAGGPAVAIGYRHRTSHVEDPHPTLDAILSAERDDRLVELLEPVEAHATPWLYVYSCNFSVSLRGPSGEADPTLRFDEGFSGWGLEDTELGYRLYHGGYRVIEADGARVLHIEDPAPRDPFRCEVRELPPTYDTYVKNAVYFMDKYPEDAVLREWVRGDLRWYIVDENGHFVKNGFANDVDAVIERCRAERRDPSIRESA